MRVNTVQLAFKLGEIRGEIEQAKSTLNNLKGYSFNEETRAQFLRNLDNAIGKINRLVDQLP